MGDLSIRELNTLELAMLSALDFQLFVTREEYNTSVRMLWDLLPTTPSPVAHPLHAEPTRPLLGGGERSRGAGSLTMLCTHCRRAKIKMSL